MTVSDMEEMYDLDLLIQATNYSDRNADTIDEAILTDACQRGSDVCDGYLARLSVPSTSYSARFLTILRTHAGRLAMDALASTDPQIRKHAEETMEWLKELMRMDLRELEILATGGVSEEAIPDKPNPVVSFGEGRYWEVDLW